jgi:hypothetical protein
LQGWERDYADCRRNAFVEVPSHAHSLSLQLAAHLLEGFGGAALLLWVAGLYGLRAYVVAERTHELGVRIALGAARGNLLWLVMQ